MDNMDEVTARIRALAPPMLETEDETTVRRESKIKNAMDKVGHIFWQAYIKDKVKRLRAHLLQGDQDIFEPESESSSDGFSAAGDEEEDDEEAEEDDEMSDGKSSVSLEDVVLMTGEGDMHWDRDNVVAMAGDQEEHPHVSEYFGAQWDHHIVSLTLRCRVLTED
jgi:hypothetical protein